MLHIIKINRLRAHRRLSFCKQVAINITCRVWSWRIIILEDYDFCVRTLCAHKRSCFETSAICYGRCSGIYPHLRENHLLRFLPMRTFSRSNNYVYMYRCTKKWYLPARRSWSGIVSGLRIRRPASRSCRGSFLPKRGWWRRRRCTATYGRRSLDSVSDRRETVSGTASGKGPATIRERSIRRSGPCPARWWTSSAAARTGPMLKPVTKQKTIKIKLNVKSKKNCI